MIRINEPADIHRALHDLRILSLTSQRQLGAEIGVLSKRISDYEQGRCTPNAITLVRLFAGLGWQLALVPLEEQP